MPPQDPRLAKVYALFDGACAQCHQTGKLTRAAPSGGFANVLALDDIAREPSLVRAGQPDASRIYQVLLDRHRPVDIGAQPKWPDAEDIQRIRTWIEETDTPRKACTTRAPIPPAAIAKSIDTAVRAAGETAALELRFVTLTHLYNSCATPTEMEAYRNGVAKLLNSLSWGARPVVLTTVDEAKTILSFTLSDIGWVDEHWSALARAEPKGIALDLTGQVSAPNVNARPIRGDWMAWAASQPPFYAELLGLPATLEETSKLLGIRRDDATQPKPRRAGFKSTGVTRGPRVVEHASADQRRLWTAFEFIDGTGERDIFDRPLGSIRGAPDKAQFRADGQRIMFTLPNGFLAFGVHDADGRRIDVLPQRLELDAARLFGATSSGLTCLSCHGTGPKSFTDSVRPHVASDKYTGPREAKDQALALYDADWPRIVDDESYRYRRALIQAGIDPDVSIHGLEMITALARRYTLGVDFDTAADEAGLSSAEFASKLSTVEGIERSLVLRLRQGVLSRPDVNKVLAALKSKTADTDAGLAAAAPPASQNLKLSVWSDRATYKAGDLMTVYAQPSAPCNLTLISVNGAGKATVLYPNEFEPDNLVAAEAIVSVPTEKSQYQFRFKDKGTETVIGTCQTVARYPAGIEPDYERQRFTVLGNYENFVRTTYTLEPVTVRTEKPKPQPKPKDKDAKSESVKPEPPRAEQIARSAVRIVIE
jgi:hypothetical protein